MSGGLSDEAIMRLLARAVPAIARRSVPVPSTRLGTVAQTSDPAVTYVEVLVDGDDTAISVLNGTGGPLAQGQRVVVNFYPPHGAVVAGVLLPAFPLEQLWSTTVSAASHATTSTAGSNGWSLLTADGAGWTSSGADLVCEVAGLWSVDLMARWASDGGGTHRAAAVVNSAGGHECDVSEQFNAPGGTPTTSYGVSSAGFDVADFEVDATLSALARQDSGGALVVTLFARLRLLGPSA